MSKPYFSQQDVFLPVSLSSAYDRLNALETLSESGVIPVESTSALEAASTSTNPTPTTVDSLPLLDPSSLQTVLDMLEVIEDIEELELLETLTDAQKKQVWAATPPVVKAKLKQIRATAIAQPPPIALQVEQEQTKTEQLSDRQIPSLREENEASKIDSEPELDDDSDEDLDLAAGAWEDWALNQEAVPASLWQTSQPTFNKNQSLAEPDLEAGHLPQATRHQTSCPVAVGDWVVLQAQPKLSRAELIAIWEVKEIQGKFAQVWTKTLGFRNYPIAWMVIYPQPPSQA